MIGVRAFEEWSGNTGITPENIIDTGRAVLGVSA